MTTWIPMFALPNIEVPEPIELPGLALATWPDERLVAIAQKHRRFAMYLRRFNTEFGQTICPSIIIRESSSPETYCTAEAIAGFRDAIAMAVIPYSWAHALCFGSTEGIRYSNWFTFYPWMIDKEYDGLVMHSLAQIALHEVRALRGQSTPGFTCQRLESRTIDMPILRTLLRRWEARFQLDHSQKSDLALFRALNMANSAAMLPGNVEVTIYDIGRSIALWVSAFEIIAHPGSSNVGFKQVCQLLSEIKWKFSKCSELNYELYKHKSGQSKVNLATWLYGELYRSRNDFLHGNPITTTQLTPFPARQSLHLFAAPLFRMALAAFLNLDQNSLSTDTIGDSTSALLSFNLEFGAYQRDFEAALATILFTRDEHLARRASSVGRRSPPTPPS